MERRRASLNFAAAHSSAQDGTIAGNHRMSAIVHELGQPDIADATLPVVITASRAEESPSDAYPALAGPIARHLRTVGGVLFRGFRVPSVHEFRQFAAGFGHPLLSYDFGSTPRSMVADGGIYSSTEYPAHQSIPLHNEQSYTREWPMKIWFHCVTAARQGGETPIADSRAIYRRMPARIRELFSPGILYVRNYGEFDVPWQKVFNTAHRDEVEAFCRQRDIRYEWNEDGGLRTAQLCQATAVHPVTGETVWFNQAHLFHVSNLAAEVRESLEDILGIDNMPRNTYLADGSPIEEPVLQEIRAVLDAETIAFPWHEGDVLMLDNMLCAHARSPFEGARRVVVAMAEPYAS